MASMNFRLLLFSILITLFLFCHITFAQNHGINWILGYGNKNDTSVYGRSILNFENENLNITRNGGGYKFMMGFENNSYSDESGKLRFFYDGFRIGNAIDYKIVQNGDTLNPGVIWQEFNGGFYPISNASVFIPPLSKDSLLMLFHMPLDFVPGRNDLFHSPVIYLTKINTSANQGKGRVFSKNEIVFKGDLSPMVFSACRHANGRDWWLICKAIQNSTYYTLLVDIDKNSIVKIDSQNIGFAYADYSTDGNSVFSPDGRKFARSGFRDKLQVFDFDRCEGKLYNFTQIINDSIQSSNSLLTVAISSNSRFLYITTGIKIFQYDLNDPDIQNSYELIGEWDGFFYNKYFTTKFCDIQLAPDDKIYISCASSNVYLHRIEYPDLKGKACDFQLRKITLPTYMGCGLGNYPNYLLKIESGTSCDSLIVNNQEPGVGVYSFYPNPSNGQLILECKNCQSVHQTYLVSVINTAGSIRYTKVIQTGSQKINLNLNFLESGLYFLVLQDENKKIIQSHKWIVN